MRKLLISTLPGLTLALLGILAGFAPHGAAAQSAPAFVLSPQTQTVNLSAGTVSVQVQVQNASNAAGFQFTLRYDPGVLSNPTVQPGSLFPSPQCPDPIIDNSGPTLTPDPGTVKYGCATGSASGSGTLATVTFHLAGGDHTALNIEHAVLDNAVLTGAQAICDPCAAQNGSITVTGGAASSDKGLGTPPPPPPVDITNPPPVGGVPVASNPGGSAGGSTSGSGTTGAGGTTGTGTGGTTGTGTGSTAGSGATGTIPRSGTTSGGTAGASTGGAAHTGVGKFGFGPQPQHNNDRRNALLAAFGMAVAGAGMLAAASRRRRARQVPSVHQ